MNTRINGRVQPLASHHRHIYSDGVYTFDTQFFIFAFFHSPYIFDSLGRGELWRIIRLWRLWQSLLVKRGCKCRVGRSWGDMKLIFYQRSLLHSRWKTQRIPENTWSNTELILIPFLSHTRRCIRLYGCSWPISVSSLHHPVPKGQRIWALSGIRKPYRP